MLNNVFKKQRATVATPSRHETRSTITATRFIYEILDAVKLIASSLKLADDGKVR
jgi:hypothetical protein